MLGRRRAPARHRRGRRGSAGRRHHRADRPQHDARGIGEAHLVGHSLGGAVVTKAAAKAPEKVERLTLIAPAGFGTAINAAYLHDGVDKVLTSLLDTLLDGDEQAIDAARLLSTVDIPSKIVWGRQDAVLPPGTADVYVEDTGHLVHLEAPGAVIAAITG
ncbi:alpha/beta fold hydrolase [Amycolatopsis sp. NPDC101161]|uniref:alpha/beta fold hydrolase n=1 Tax=Amycolatopsis sp. NPDC101161 TaxID=3363940 RepID=UPI0037F4492E